MSSNSNIDVDFDDIEDIPREVDPFITTQDGEIRVKVDVGGRQNTVKAREALDFEYELVDELVETKTDKFRRGGNIPIKGPWISGWLQNHGPDYIAGIFKNYQFFLKFVEGRTQRMENRSTVERAPGTYDSMYTYILLLEDLDLVERFKREEIPENEFDHPIPEEFQDRTFVRVTTPFSEAEEDWSNPYRALYPDNYEDEEDVDEMEGPEPEADIDEDEERNIDEDEEEGGEEDDIEDVEEDDTDDEEEDVDFEDVETIADFQNPKALLEIIDERFKDSLQEAIDDPPIPGAGDDFNSDQFERGRVGVYGVWAEGDATPGETQLNMVIEMINQTAPRNAGFIAAGTQTELERSLNLNNEIPDLFPSYDVTVTFSGGFEDNVENRVERSQDEQIYYEVTQGEFIEI